MIANFLRSLRQAFTQIIDTMRHVFQAAFLIAHLALDAQCPAVPRLLERLDKLTDVYLSLSERDFFPPVAGDFRAVRILDVDAADVRTEEFDRLLRIALVVEQHVGWIEVDLQVRTLELVQRQA